MLARHCICAVLTLLTATLCTLVSPQAAFAQPADQKAVDFAVETGVNYLRRSQNPGGSWGTGTGPGSGKGWGVGHTALTGLALVECGVPITDAGLKRAAAVVRNNVNELENTYELALAILFLDRMKDKADKPHIQYLAARLMAGQMYSGGWGYNIPKYTRTEMTQFLDGLRRMSPPPTPIYPSVRERPPSLGLCIKAGDDILLRPPPAFDPVKAKAAAMPLIPPTLRELPVMFDGSGQLPDDPKEKRSDTKDATTDNSNTHFAMIGLWAARKHDVPTDRSFTLVARRFRNSQGPNGTWGYDFARNGANGGAATTCIALLGVAIGYVVAPEPNVRPDNDPVVLNAFKALSGSIGAPAGTTANRPKVKDVGGLYFMWAMERIAVLYDLRTLDKKDWYLWGAEILVGNQQPDGSWADGGFPGENVTINTSLAILFLRRANLTPDLSRRLILDTNALTAKVDKEQPKKEPPPPTVDPTPQIETAPYPRAVEPKITPQPQPPSLPPQSPEPLPPTAPATPAKSGTPWLFIGLGVLLAAIVGGGLAFFVMKRKKDGDADADEDEEEAEEKPKKKAKKPKKAKPKVVEEDDE
jgi:hypothetical protein